MSRAEQKVVKLCDCGLNPTQRKPPPAWWFMCAMIGGSFVFMPLFFALCLFLKATFGRSAPLILLFMIGLGLLTVVGVAWWLVGRRRWEGPKP